MRAWRSFDNFETIEGGSFRAWLYKISTNACLNALASRKNRERFLPQLPPATGDLPSGAVIDIAWLEPYPNAYLEGIEDNATNPEACYTAYRRNGELLWSGHGELLWSGHFTIDGSPAPVNVRL